MSEETLLTQDDCAARAAATSDGGLHSDEDFVEYLERDQLVAETFRPLPRAHLGRPAVLALWALRIFAVLVSLMVIYTFGASLH
jgi:hypothetical protein